MSLDWYPWEPLAFRKKTLHLTLEQDGAYRRLIDEYMIQRGPLPAGDVALSRMLGVSVEHWHSIKPAILAFFEERDGKLVHGRCEEEILEQEAKGALRSDRAKAAADKRWAEDRRLKELVAVAMPKASGRHPRRSASSMPAASAVHAASNAPSMLANATLQNKDITTTCSVAARPFPVEKAPEETNPAGSLASALPAGALTRQPETEQAAPVANESAEPASPADGHPKKPAEATRAEMEALFALKRGIPAEAPPAPIDTTIPKFLERKRA